LRKAAVFLDGGYLDWVQREFGGLRLDYTKLCNELVGKEVERIRTYYYHCAPYQSPRPTRDESARYASFRSFADGLQRLPRFETRLGRLARRDSGFEQKGVDVLLSVDLVRMSWSRQIDSAVLLTGDSDFVPAVQAA